MGGQSLVLAALLPWYWLHSAAPTRGRDQATRPETEAEKIETEREYRGKQLKSADVAVRDGMDFTVPREQWSGNLLASDLPWHGSSSRLSTC